ncbi:MAG TPA: nucleotidyltransferase family protein [Solirubrobacteraceae bacterium]|nr:nucleotidyltransferase family protein [Solirubrobacteraceae bacterium]
MPETDDFHALIQTLKNSVAALRERDIPFMLGGSLAAWARGGPEPKKDLDLMVKPQDAERALEALVAAGMTAERPPEEWLVKAWHDEVLVDVIFRPSGLEITDEVLARADTIPLMAVGTPVMALEDVLVTMLCALDEHGLDYTRLIAIARSLREQIDFPRLQARTSDHPYARAFFTLVQELGVAPASPAGHAGASEGQSRVRVLPGGA